MKHLREVVEKPVLTQKNRIFMCSVGIKLLLARDQIDVVASEGRVKEYVLKS